jgi:hypothetical protein
VVKAGGPGLPRGAVELRGRMYSELAQYVAPKRKAMEHSAGGEIEEWLARIATAKP